MPRDMVLLQNTNDLELFRQHQLGCSPHCKTRKICNLRLFRQLSIGNKGEMLPKFPVPILKDQFRDFVFQTCPWPA